MGVGFLHFDEFAATSSPEARVKILGKRDDRASPENRTCRPDRRSNRE